MDSTSKTDVDCRGEGSAWFCEAEEYRAQIARLRGLWQDDDLIGNLFLAHTREDVAYELRQALTNA